jgi:DNA-binding IscR family transcriptional regulator
MKTQRQRDFFCYNSENSTKWHLSGVSASEALALTALVLKAKLGGMVYASQAELAAVVKCNRATLNKGLQSLITKDLVSPVPGKRAQYQINPQIGTKLA